MGKLARSLEEEKRLCAEGLGRERNTSDRALVLLKQNLEQLQKDLAKCSTQTDKMQQDRCQLREEVMQLSQSLEDLSNNMSGKGCLGHRQTEQIELCMQRLDNFASESQQRRNAIEAEVAEVVRKFESLQGDLAEKEQARDMEYTSLAELCAHLGHQSENMPHTEVQEVLAQSVAKIAEESKQHLADLVKKDSATRVDKLFNLSQRLEDLEQSKEIQNQLESVIEDGRKSLEEARGREAAMRTELSVLFEQRFDGVEESCHCLHNSQQQESSRLEDLQVQLRQQVEAMLNEFLQNTEERLSLCENLTASMSHRSEETSDRTVLCSVTRPTSPQLPASSSALLSRSLALDMPRLFYQLARFMEDLATMGMGAVVYTGTGLCRRLLHSGLQQ